MGHKLDNQNNTTYQNNKLLIGFLNYKDTTPSDFDFSFYEPETDEVKKVTEYSNGKTIEKDLLEASGLTFHLDYNMINQVLEKIQRLPYVYYHNNSSYDISNDKVNVSIKFEYYSSALNSYPIKSIVVSGTNNLETLYNACVEFVKWYNERYLFMHPNTEKKFL